MAASARPPGSSARTGARRLAAALAAFVILAGVGGCVSVTVKPRALLLDSAGHVEVQSLDCTGPAFAARRSRARTQAQALDPHDIRVVTWNLHKQADPGWQRELRDLATDSDIVLLQEVILDPPLRATVEDAGLRWVMASSFLRADVDIGVLTGSRRLPLASCTQRVVEPLIRIPKSAVITWFRLAGSSQTLAVVNVHAINFAVMLSGYRAQLMALAAALEDHPGPVIFAGDLNTWTDARSEVMREIAARLDLTEVTFRTDRRSMFFGHQLDHIFVRGLDEVDAEAIPVHSSDHNPVRATFRLAQRSGLQPASTSSHPPGTVPSDPGRSGAGPAGSHP